MAGERKRWPFRAGALAVAGLLALAMVIQMVWRPWSVGARPDQHLPLVDHDPSTAALDSDTEARIVAFCSDCHAMPRAESFPRDRWHHEVRMGYEFYARSGRNDLDPPPMHLTVAYYRSRAPDEPRFPEPKEADTELRATFRVDKLTLGKEPTVLPELSYLRWTRLRPEDNPVLVACDMRYGYVAAVDLHDPNPYPRTLARLENPCHVEPCDLDGNQAIDLLVADLGSSVPYDHDQGRVVWLRSRQTGDSLDEVVLASGLGRVADVRPADFDADGDLDLIVAEFGHLRTGNILLLRNTSVPGQSLHFEPEELDPRPGTIHVPVHDFNRDGRPDFVALVSQEYESVDLFLNQGDGRFRLQTLWSAPDLTFGSSGIELVDLDQDGDVDVLYANGDAWDNWYATPWHGIGWLENLGGLQFAHHRLTDMPGACRALAGDVDLDGDLDVVAVAWLPPPVKPASLKEAPLASVLCLEQTKPGVFVRHTLEAGFPYYAALEMADFDHDGDLDLAVGPGPHVSEARQESHWLAVWWNQAAAKGE